MTDVDTEIEAAEQPPKERRPARRQVASRDRDAVDRLVDSFRSLSRGWALIGIATLLSVGIGLVATLTASKVYEATALIEVFEGPPEQQNNDPESVQRANQTLAQTYAATLNSRSFLTRIAPNVGDGGTGAAALNANVSASAVPETGLVSLTVTEDSEQGAIDLATQVVGAFTGAIREDAVNRNEAQQAQLREQIESLDEILSQRDDFSVQTARSAAAERLSRVILANSEVGTNVGLAGPPESSGDPISPRPVFNLLVALLVGLIIGAALTWVGRRIDRGGAAH